MNRNKILDIHIIDLEESEAKLIIKQLILTKKYIDNGNSYYVNPWFISQENGAPLVS